MGLQDVAFVLIVIVPFLLLFIGMIIGLIYEAKKEAKKKLEKYYKVSEVNEPDVNGEPEELEKIKPLNPKMWFR